jgi:hypothetical protein
MKRTDDHAVSSLADDVHDGVGRANIEADFARCSG